MMSTIPYDILPMCEPDFARMKPKQKQSFVSRFFGARVYEKKEDNTQAICSRNSTPETYSAVPSTSSSYVSLNTKASTSSMRIPMATNRRPRSNTADSSTSIASFVSQNSVDSRNSYRRISSRFPSRERQVSLDDDWTPVHLY
jgi:hypothetical protein